MFISRPSEPRTILLWGDRWWIAGSETPLPFNDPDHAVEVLVAHLTEEPKPVRLKLIFQPDGFETVAVACPRGDRATLAAALAGEHTAMANPACAWSHEPILPMGADYSTLLHLESQPTLKHLATELALRGLAVDSAWPLATFLHALPFEWSESGALTIVAIEPERALAYRHPADGVRSVLHWSGDATVTEVTQWLSEILNRNPTEPMLVVAADEAVAGAFSPFVDADRYPEVERIPLADALGRPVVLPRYHPAQLLPRPPLVDASRVMIAASIACLLAAGWSGFVQIREHLAVRDLVASHRVQLRTLRAEVAHLRENASEIAAIQRSIAGGADGPPAGRWLEKISSGAPPQITLSSLRLAGHSLTLTGWVAPGAARSVLDDWRNQLAAAGAVWTLDHKSGTAGFFSLTGDFRL